MARGRRAAGCRGVDGRAGRVHPRRAGQAARPRRDRRPAARGVLLRRAGRADPPQGPLLLHPQARGQGEERRLLEAGRQGRRPGAVRSQHLERRRLERPGRLVAEQERRLRRLRQEGEQRRRDRHLRPRPGQRQGPARRHPRHQVLGGVVDAGRQGLLLHVGAAGRRRRHDRQPPRLRRAALPRARHRPGQRSDHPREDRQPADVPRRLGVLGRQVAGRRGPARLELERPVLQGRAHADRAVDPADRGRRRQLRDHGVEGPLLRQHQRRRAALPGVRGRSAQAGPGRLEGDRAAVGRHPRVGRRDRRQAGAVVPARGAERAGDPRSERQAGARDRPAAPGHRQRPDRQPRRGHRVLHLRVVHRGRGHLPGVDQDRRDQGVVAGHAADRHLGHGRRAGPLHQQGRHVDPDVPPAQEGRGQGRQEPRAALRLRRLQRQPDPGLLVGARGVARAPAA